MKLIRHEIVKSIFPRVLSVPGVLAFPVNPPSLGSSFLGQPIAFVIQGNDYGSLNSVTQDILSRAQAIPGVINLDSDLKLNKPELLVEIDRNRANDLGISVRNIATTLQVLLGGKDFATFEEAGEQYNVMVQLWGAIQRTLCEVFPAVHPYFGYSPIYGTGMWT